MGREMSEHQLWEYVQHEWPVATAAAMRFIKAQGHDIKIVPNDPLLARKYEQDEASRIKFKNYVRKYDYR